MNRLLYNVLRNYFNVIEPEFHKVTYNTAHYYESGIVNTTLDNFKLVAFENDDIPDAFISVQSPFIIKCATPEKAIRELLHTVYADPMIIKYSDFKGNKITLAGNKYWMMVVDTSDLIYALARDERRRFHLIVNSKIYYNVNPVIKFFKNQVIPFMTYDLELPVLITERINRFSFRDNEVICNNIIYDSVLEGAPLSQFINSDRLFTNSYEP